jgi:hypothetical protein
MLRREQNSRLRMKFLGGGVGNGAGLWILRFGRSAPFPSFIDSVIMSAVEVLA